MKPMHSLLTTILFVLLFAVQTQAQVTIKCQQRGAFMATFKISYESNGRPYAKESGHLAVGGNFDLTLPQDAKNINIRTAIMYFIGVWHEDTTPVYSGGTFTLGGALHNETRDWVPDGQNAPVANPVAANNVDEITPTTQDTKVHLAIRRNDAEEVNRLFRANFSLVNSKNSKGMTPLHEAVAKENSVIIDKLIREGADPEIADNQSVRPLDLAIQKGNMEIVQKLIDHGAAVRVKDEDLAKAIQMRKEPLVQLLLKHGVDPVSAMKHAMKYNNITFYQTILDTYQPTVTNNMFEEAVNDRKYTFAELLLDQNMNMNQALDAALKSNQKNLIYKAMDRGADPARALAYAVDQKDEILATAVIVNYRANPNPVFASAVSSNQHELVRTMLHNGADPELGMPATIQSGQVQMVNLLLDAGADPERNMIPAVKAGKLEIVKSLISRGADPGSGLSAAMAGKQFDIAELLIETGAEPIDVVATAVEMGQTTLLQAAISRNADPNPGLPVAVAHNNTEYVRLLLDSGADATRGFYVETAAQARNSQMIDLLLAAGADPNPGMMVAVEQGNTTLLKTLIDNNARVDNPLFISKSVSQKRTDMVQTLLTAGADPNPGMQPAIDLMDVEITRILLRANADASPVSYIGKASSAGNLAIVDLLIHHGADANAGMLPAITANQPTVVSRLLAAGADGSASNLVTSATPHNNPALTGLLFQAGADPQGALSPAVSSGADQVLTQIIGLGVDVSDHQHLVTAVQKNFVPVSKILLDNGAKATVKETTTGYTLMHVAARNNSAGMVALLASHGVDVNEASISGDTPLHLGVLHGNEGLTVVETLVNLGADVNARNTSGTIIYKAAKGGKIKKLLKQYDASKK